MGNAEALYLSIIATLALFAAWEFNKKILTALLREKLKLHKVEAETPEQRAARIAVDAAKKRLRGEAAHTRYVLEEFLRNGGDFYGIEGQARFDAHLKAHAKYVSLMGYDPHKDTYCTQLASAKASGQLPSNPYDKGGYHRGPFKIPVK